MPTQIGIASASITDSLKAGSLIGKQALQKAGIVKAGFALAFCSGKHDPHKFLEGVQSVLGNVPLVGGSSMGIITADSLGYEGYESGITVFASDTLQFQVFAEGNIDKDERIAGEKLGQSIASVATENDKGLLVFYDSSKQQNPPMLNFATWLFEGLETHLPSHLTCAGGGLLSDMMLSTTYQFFNNTVLTQHAVAVLIGGGEFHTTIMHGCKPASAYLTITNTEGPVVTEINHRPAVEVIDELMGNGAISKWKDFALFVTLGVNKGEKFAPFNEKNYANRLVLAVDEPSKSLVMFEPDLKAGDEVQLMRRSVDLNYIQTGIESLREKMNGSKPVFSFYINCAGRAKPYAGGQFEDAEEVQKSMGSIPFMGFYSGVEIAEMNHKLQPLDWTGVLCVISE